MSTSPVPHVPPNAPFSEAQRQWLNGYFAGLFSTQAVDGTLPGSGAPAAPGPPVTILYGSQTGTAEGLARQTAKAAKERGLQPSVMELDEIDPHDLASVARLLVVTSTYGDGEMPDNAALFWEALSSDEAPALPDTSFSVLALGDSSYPDFCQAGKDIDIRLEELGATRLHPRVDCDLDFDAPFEAWLDEVLDVLAAPAGDGATMAAPHPAA